jgi:AraC family transcriptional regulator
MTNLLSLGKTQYLGDITDLRVADGVIFSAVSAHSPKIGNDALHFHENPIISFILEGDSLERINRDTNQRSAGDIRFYRAGDLHQVRIKRFPSRNINFELEKDFLVQNHLSEEKIRFSIEKNPYAKQLLLRICKEFSENDEFSVSSIQILLFNLVTENNSEVSDRKPVWINALYELLNDRWNEQLSLRELGYAVNVHPVTISKYFTKYFACTFGEYMRRLRINKSIHLIKNSGLSLTEIAFRCGFADQSHFTRNFKELTGFLPKDFRKF